MNGMVPTYANAKHVKLSCPTRLLLTGQAKHLAQVSVSSVHWTLVCSTSTCSLLGTTSDFSALDYQTQHLTIRLSYHMLGMRLGKTQ